MWTLGPGWKQIIDDGQCPGPGMHRATGPRTGGRDRNVCGDVRRAVVWLEPIGQVELVCRTRWRLDPARLQSQAGLDLILYTWEAVGWLVTVVMM